MTWSPGSSDRGRYGGGPEYDLVNYTDKAELVLRDDGNEIHVLNSESELEWVEMRCERCGHFAKHVSPIDHGTCLGHDTPQACAEAAALRGEES